MDPVLADQYHRELTSLQQWIDADRKAIADEEAAIEKAKKRIKRLTKNVEKRQEGWDAIYRAFMRIDAELPARQPELFGPDPIPEPEAKNPSPVDEGEGEGEGEDPEMDRFVYGPAPTRRAVPTTRADETPVRPAKGSTRGAAARAVTP